ncbi:MAG: hypothetical protein HYV18_04770 [Gammaproteobacteria bacterium]|nr:hypothetical protein [Gammaproteobacteria bacterium]
MRAINVLFVALLLPLSACDPSARCAKQIAQTEAEINEARSKTTDVDKVNRIVEAAQRLSSAEHRRVSGETDACFAEVEKARQVLERETAGR